MLRHTKHSGGLPVAMLLVGLVVGGRAEGQRVTDGKDVVVFENATIEIVRVYLVDRGSDWLLGRAEPGRVTVLPLPPGFAGQSGGQVSLVAVPFGAPGGRGASPEASPSAVRSEPEPAENLWRMRWKFAGCQLFSVPRSR